MICWVGNSGLPRRKTSAVAVIGVSPAQFGGKTFSYLWRAVTLKVQDSLQGSRHIIFSEAKSASVKILNEAFKRKV